MQIEQLERGKRNKVEWVTTSKFLDIISPFITFHYNFPSDPRGYLLTIYVNNVQIGGRCDKDGDLVRKAIRRERTKMKVSTAERILSRCGLDPHVDEIIL